MLNLPKVQGVPKHMKRFEILITFDSAKICCLFFLLINLFYINDVMPYFDLI